MTCLVKRNKWRLAPSRLFHTYRAAERHGSSGKRTGSLDPQRDAAPPARAPTKWLAREHIRRARLRSTEHPFLPAFFNLFFCTISQSKPVSVSQTA